MSTDLKGKKRKSGDNVEPVTKAKKVKTTTATVKSSERPAPTKSALKKAETTTITEKTKEKSAKAASKPAKKDVIVEKKVEVEPEISSDEEDADGGAELTPDQTNALLAGFSSDEDSDEEGEDQDGIPISSLPAAPTSASKSKKGKQASSNNPDPESTPGTVYISRIPHGFYEPQMRAYFSQFGSITRLRLARNRKTGKSQHHAFIEFAASSVADIVAKTMDKYLLFGHLVQCKRVPAEQVKEGMWMKGGGGGGKKRKNGSGKGRNKSEGRRLGRGTDKEGWERRITREEKRRVDKEEKLKEMGYEFAMPAVKGVEGVSGKKLEGKGAEEVALKIAEDATKEEPEPTAVVEETIVAKIENGPKGKAVVGEKTTKRKGNAPAAAAGDAAATTTVTKKRKIKA